MPIVYVHGVSIRDEQGWELLEGLMRQYVAPKISKDPENVMIKRCFWGDYGAKFRWSGASAPTSPLRALMPKLRQAAATKIAMPANLELNSFSAPATKLKKAARRKFDELSLPTTLPEARTKVAYNMHESMKRGAHSAGHVMARAAAEIKSPMNRFVTLFVGDVLTYVHERGNAKAPGWIPSSFLATLAEAHENKLERDREPLIVMSHSMGGQIVYDAITHFMPNLPEFKNVKIDMWVATASQIGLFEELKLFIESSEDYSLETGVAVPFPSKHVGYWWNVWDHNDFVSYSVRGIVDGVDDEAYNTGLFVVSAHGAYLEMPSFFRRFARKVRSVLGSV